MIEVMTTNQVRARREEIAKPAWRRIYLVIAAVIVVFGGAAGFLAFGNYFGGLLPESFETIVAGDKRIIKVPAGGNLQSAINRAASGDVIVLDPGATYNEIVLPKKNITDFITIQSSAADQLPADVRVSPQQSRSMAKITTRGGGKSAVATDNGAHHFRFVGIEFVPTAKDYVYNLIYLGATSNLVADVPHDLEFDRCLIRSTSNNVTRRGIGLNSANTVVKNSYLEGFAFPQEETQAICGWTGTKNVKIINNYIEGGAENVMFGGSDPASAELIPQDIEVRGNHFNKPEAWRGKNSMKCLFEIKNAKRLQFTDNYLENNWLGAAFRITVRNQEGKAPFSTIEDIVIKNNVVRGTGEGINILGKDDTYPSQTMKNVSIANNLFLDIGASGYEGGGYFIQISGGENVLIANNTAFNNGNIASLYGDIPRNFLFRDNIVGHGNYGIHGLPTMKSPEAARMFRNNVIINNRRVGSDDTSFPAGNFFVQDASNVGFVNYNGKDLGLSPNSRFKGKGTNRTDIGVDFKLLPKRL
jgi:hypothetical protein